MQQSGFPRRKRDVTDCPMQTNQTVGIRLLQFAQCVDAMIDAYDPSVIIERYRTIPRSVLDKFVAAACDDATANTAQVREYRILTRVALTHERRKNGCFRAAEAGHNGRFKMNDTVWPRPIDLTAVACAGCQ